MIHCPKNIIPSFILSVLARLYLVYSTAVWADSPLNSIFRTYFPIIVIYTPRNLSGCNQDLPLSVRQTWGC